MVLSKKFFDKNNSFNNIYLGLGLANNIGIQNESFNKTLSFFFLSKF